MRYQPISYSDWDDFFFPGEVWWEDPMGIRYYLEAQHASVEIVIGNVLAYMVM